MMNSRYDLGLCSAFLVGVLSAMLVSTSALAFDVQLTVTEIDHANGTSGPYAGGYRWMVEEDTTHPVVPGRVTNKSLAFETHKSYAPVQDSGHSAGGPVTISLPDNLPDSNGEATDVKRYYVSVLPDSGAALGGTTIVQGQSVANVAVQVYPIPTAQISVVVFDDSAPTDNQWNGSNVEPGLAGFSIVISDDAGQVIQDAFGNPLGTTYVNNDPDDGIANLGSGLILTAADGSAFIKNIPPGKYGVIAIPPLGSSWIQTNTIEGKKTLDAWVEANEPIYFQEFGPAGPHTLFGFTRPFGPEAPNGGNASVRGHVVSLHNSRPPETGFFPGADVPGCWVAVNAIIATGEGGESVYAGPCEEDSTFDVQGLDAGTYDVVFWDEALDYIFGTRRITLADGQSLDLGDVMVFAWFGRLENQVFADVNENGFWDAGEPGIPEQNVNIRFRDGSIYSAFPTDVNGYVPFDEVFPFFHYLVAEVDFARYKATGATIAVDGGGAIVTNPGDVLEPQPQITADGLGTPIINPVTNDNLSRTETGAVLTQAFQAFLGQTIRIDWGKTNYGPNENGGISGVVMYAVTRAEDDPALAAGEEWEPGIPNVVVNLYEDFDADGIPDGPAIRTAETDSWDANLPTGCPPDPDHTTDGSQNPFIVAGTGGLEAQDCFEGLRSYTQMRDGVFDGGYAFGGPAGEEELPEGTYIVEAIAPPGYKHLVEEAKNVDFGDEYIPSSQLLPPVCVGDRTSVGLSATVPAELELFPGIAAPFAGEVRPLCNRKQVIVGGGGVNAAADFWMYTDVPKAARIVGFILNDLASEFDPTSPQLGEKFAPSWVPVSIRDWAGTEVSRVYSDQYGKYNALVPSTFTVNAPMPTGVSPNMMTVCLNSPGPIDDGNGGQIIDPYYDARYSQWCYTLQYWPGRTTYLDTPVVPISAHAGPDRFPLDCEPLDETPRIAEVNGPSGGPFVESSPGVHSVSLESLGATEVRNPWFDPDLPGSERLETRHFGFGSGTGSITLNGASSPFVSIASWTDASISLDVTVDPTGTTGLQAGAYQLLVTRSNGQTSPVGISLEIGDASMVKRVGVDGTTIQETIDNATEGDLVLVPPGLYQETVILYKELKLQGYGENTIISAIQNTADTRILWNDKLTNLETAGLVSALDGQVLPSEVDQALGTAAFERGFTPFQGSPIFVMPRELDTDDTPYFDGDDGSHARIDGFTLSGSDGGGGIGVNGFAHDLEISNNRIVNNAGTFGAGIRIGVADLVTDGTQIPVSSENSGVHIHHNHVAENGSFGGPGGIALNHGADGYVVEHNNICGNFSTDDGAGIGHYGLSEGGVIRSNEIVFNEAWNGTTTGAGGGILIAGEPPVAGSGATATSGSGSVTIDKNLIMANSAGTGNGGGVLLSRVDGVNLPAAHKITITNNIIVKNVAGLAGAVVLGDATDVDVVHNTIVNNVSTASAAGAFQNGSEMDSVPMAAGLVVLNHTPELASVVGPGSSVPTSLSNNISYNNSSFYFDWDTVGILGNLVDGSSHPNYQAEFEDFWTESGTPLAPTNSVVRPGAGGGSNVGGDVPLSGSFVAACANNAVDPVNMYIEVTTPPVSALVIDEGGNFLDVAFGPLTQDQSVLDSTCDYHLMAGSSANDIGAATPSVPLDIDGEARSASSPDAGADEFGPSALAKFDIDVDGISNPLDNCVVTGNTDQRDPNGDGFGAICDPDLTNDLVTNFADFAAFVGAFAGPYSPDADFNGDTFINFGDLGVMAIGFNKPPGPSGIVRD